MKLYLLVEGKTEAVLYPRWISYVAPGFCKAEHSDDVSPTGYYLFNCGGYPGLLVRAQNAAYDVHEKNYDCLAVCLDADDEEVAAKKAQVLEALKSTPLFDAKTRRWSKRIEVFVQRKCIESWLLGNTKFFKPNPQAQTLAGYIRYYDVSQKDPENMGKNGFDAASHFHYKYLSLVFKERNTELFENKTARRKRKSCFDEIVKRSDEGDLSTFRSFFNFLLEIARIP
mgnify:CR=1 FL=1